MSRAVWITRPIASVEMKPVRNGHHALIFLACGHVIEWKASRFRTYAPKRLRCDECAELHKEFLSADGCARVVSLIERGKAHDFATNKRVSGVAHAGGQTHSDGRAKPGRVDVPGIFDGRGLAISGRSHVRR